MSFEDRPFILLFLITYLLWWCVRHREQTAVGVLLTASLIFYGHNHWKLLPILLLYCVINWWIAIAIEDRERKRVFLTIGVTFNLTVLCFYKYTPLVAKTLLQPLFSDLPAWLNSDFKDWSIPYGISFYAFTGIAYMVDVYRRTTHAERNLARYTLSAAFFPHLVAGPILRANEYLDYVRPGRLAREPLDANEATWLIARGLFKKLVVANRLGLAIDPFFAHVGDSTTSGAWALPYVYLYALQIYFDFSAYTDMARGLGLLFGYRWPENFNLPYLASNIAEFWRRWHMTLSRFLRDYLYIPLGGNRHGPIRTSLNLMITMLLGGLWHGASWSFLMWGGLHGLYLMLHRIWATTAIATWLKSLGGLAGLIWMLTSVAITFHAVCLAWCFFRLTHFSDSLACVRKCVEFDPSRMWSGTHTDPSVFMALGAYSLILLIAMVLRRFDEIHHPVVSGFRWGFRIATVGLAVLLSPPDVGSPFIYFQF